MSFLSKSSQSELPIRTAARTGTWLAFAIAIAGTAAAMLTTSAPRNRIIPAVLITFCFAISARLLRAVTLSGAAAGFLVTAVLFIAAGPSMLGAVLAVFVLTFGATRFGKRQKRSWIVAEQSRGRDAAQVLANIGIAAMASALSQLTVRRTPLLAASVGVLAEAACDTVSSEMGKALSGTARMITSWRLVPAGTNGAISVLGTLWGVSAALIVAAEAVATRTLTPGAGVIVVVAGISGMLFDSLLGATLEQRGSLTNNAVNLVSTMFAAVLAAIATWQFA